MNIASATSVGPSAPANSHMGLTAFFEERPQERLARRVGRVGNHRQAATRDGAADDGVLQRSRKVRDERRQVGDERVVVEGGEDRRAQEQRTCP